MWDVDALDYMNAPANDSPKADDAASAIRIALGDASADNDADDSHPRHAWHATPAEHGERLDKALATAVPAFSRTHLQALIALGHVQLDGRVIDAPARKLRAGQQVSIELVPTAQSQSFRAQAMPLAIVFEDAHLLVVNKPVGLVVHPAAGHWQGTLLNGLLAHHAGAWDLPRAGIVHRLDKDTSGLMVVAKTLAAMTALTRAIAARAVEREYIALCHGTPLDDRFTVDAPLGRDPTTRIKMAIRSDGKPAQTSVAVLASMPLAQATGTISALRCKLHTGRTHQIRVHLASRGHPLLADSLYGGAPALGLVRQALHAEALGLQHPISHAPCHWVAPIPEDMVGVWNRLMPGYNAAER
jgi:23S rRNA pseudouridine1911/1915/1917 synthase